VLTGPNVILVLKIAVAAVTVLLAASTVCALLGKYRWHGRINIVFFVLTLGAVLGLEAIIRLVDPEIFSYFTPDDRRRMTIHLCFSIPSAIMLPIMLFSGLKYYRSLHILLGLVFLVFWAGTFYTGIFTLPHGPR
jgi:hypothetical protein